MRLRLATVVAAMVLSTGCAHGGAAPTAPARPAAAARALQAPAAASKGVVLLVHGHHGGAANFAMMVPRLKADGWDPYALDFVTGDWKDWTLDELATQVALHVMALKRKSGQDKVDVVAHSLGGIVARQYVKFHGGEQHVRRLICLGAPHHGVGFAALGPMFDIARLFSPGGKALQRLNAKDETPGAIQYTNVWSPSDWAEWLPYASGRLAGAFNYKALKVNHADYPSDPRVYEVVKSSLERPLEAVPGEETEIQIGR